MTSKTVHFCDACLQDMPEPKPNEWLAPAITLQITGPVGLQAQNSVKHFHNADCLFRWLEEARPQEASDVRRVAEDVVAELEEQQRRDMRGWS